MSLKANTLFLLRPKNAFIETAMLKISLRLQREGLAQLVRPCLSSFTVNLFFSSVKRSIMLQYDVSVQKCSEVFSRKTIINNTTKFTEKHT